MPTALHFAETPRALQNIAAGLHKTVGADGHEPGTRRGGERRCAALALVPGGANADQNCCRRTIVAGPRVAIRASRLAHGGTETGVQIRTELCQARIGAVGARPRAAP